MNKTLQKCRVMVMFANNEMANLIGETRKLIDEFGVDGAETYLNAQLAILSEMRERGVGDDDDD